MRTTRRLLLSIVALGLMAAPGCRDRRQPLARSTDAGPAVQVIKAPAPGAAPVGPLNDEHEPDDDREHAQPLEVGKGVRGSLAPPMQEGAGKGDDDWYSLLAQGDGAPSDGSASSQRVDSAQQRGAPFIELRAQLLSATDVQLEIMDGEGRRLLTLDERPGGDTEVLSGLTVAAGQTVYFRVRPSPRRPKPGRPAGPVVVVPDPAYTLTVTQAAAPPGSEAEPDDTPAQATPVLAGEPVLSGVLHSKKDEDWFALTLPEAQARGGVLRVELNAPGLTPALRVESAAPPSPAPQVGKAPPPLRALLGDVKGGLPETLRLRNLGVPPGTGTLYIGLRALAWKPAALSTRYQLRATLEPPLEDAEQEPNDAPAQATVLLLSRRGGSAEGGLNGFLWPGDVDHYRIPVEGAAQVTVQLSLPPGCAASLLPAQGDAVATRDPGGRTQTLVLPASDVAQVRVVAGPPTPADPCFEAPYHLSARIESAPAAPAPAPPGG